MAINIPFGGWGTNPATGKIERYWGNGVFTQGEDPTGGRGANWYMSGGGGNNAPLQTAPQLTQSTSPTDLASQYLGMLQQSQGQYNTAIQDYLNAVQGSSGFEQRLLDEFKKGGGYPSASAYRQEYSQNQNLTPMAIESLVNRRINTTGGTIQDVINRVYGGVQQDLAAKQTAAQLAQGGVNNLLQQYQLAQSAIQPTNQTQLQFLGSADSGYYAVNPYTGEVIKQFGSGGGDTKKSLYEIDDENDTGFAPAEQTPTPTMQPSAQEPQENQLSPYLDYLKNLIPAIFAPTAYL